MSAARSVYLGESIVSDIEERRLCSDRSWSQQLVWILRLGLRAQHRVAAVDPQDTKDDKRGRQYFYPPADVDGAVEAMRLDLVKRTGAHWTYSATCRALVIVGMRFDDIQRRQLDKLLPPPGATTS